MNVPIDETDRALEMAAVNAAIWGPDTPHLWPELAAAEFLDPWCRDVVAVLVEMLSKYEPGSILTRVDPVEVAERIEQLGWLPSTSPSIVLAEVTGAGYSIHALSTYLAQLGEAVHRRAVRARLVALADTLERPGGPARVAELLGMEVVA